LCWSLSTAKGTLRYAYCSDSRSLLPYYIRALFPVVSALPQARSGEPSIVCLFYGIVGLFYKYNMSLLPLHSVSFPPILGIFWTPFSHLGKDSSQCHDYGIRAERKRERERVHARARERGLQFPRPSSCLNALPRARYPPTSAPIMPHPRQQHVNRWYKVPHPVSRVFVGLLSVSRSLQC
jgi:hypothetical protein